ncbi:MAG: DNA topoisomerase IV subunit A [Alphaproteobacteria bacterium]
MIKTSPIGEVRPQPLAEALGERYLSYALSTIMSRSLPDVRDGLKPVHRRLLYAMRLMRLDPETGFKKCARVVGEVIGKYHPHGDVAVYDAMVRLAQDFAQRYPLVEGQGNFGNLDGDNAAAMRYTEARLTAVATALLDGLDEDAVDFRPTYDGEGEEPLVLPADFPNLLANGATGIAVGMATSIPPHNAGELCEALLHLIKFPNATIVKLLEFVPGPDFPTGGVVVEGRDAIREAYATGRGGFRLRAKYEVERNKGGTYCIVVVEIPYQVQKSRLIERIAELINDKKLPAVADVRDESAEDVRLILEPKSRNIEPEAMMEMLFRQTDLEVRVPLNMNVLDAEHTPRVMNLREVLQAFLDHRHVVLVRRSKHRLAAIARRLEILEGYLIAYLNIDAVIKLIRQEDDPKPKMMKRWGLTETQAEAILNMRLRALRRLEEIEIKREHDALSAEKRVLDKLLKDEKARWATIADQIRTTRERFGQKTVLGKRRTDFADAPSAEIVAIEDLIEREPVTVVCSAMGWIRALKGHVEDVEEIRYKEGDGPRFVLRAETTDKILAFASNGRCYTLGADRLPGGRGHGEPVKLMVELEQDHEIVALFVFTPERKYLVASTQGHGFVVKGEDVLAQTRTGRQILNLVGGARLRVAVPVLGDQVAVLGENRKLLLFALIEVPEMARGRGVILQKYQSGGLADAITFTLAAGLNVKLGDKVRNFSELREWLGKRAQAGRLPPAGFPRHNRLS